MRNAIRAVGTGGMWGKGWLQGELTNERYVPVMWADFPFAAVGEQFGLVGCGVLLGVFVDRAGADLADRHLSRDLLGTYLCAGVFTMLTWQVFQNVGMTLGIMPVTGLPMPFISYGGSSLITYFAMFGIVQSVHMRRCADAPRGRSPPDLPPMRPQPPAIGSSRGVSVDASALAGSRWAIPR